MQLIDPAPDQNRMARRNLYLILYVYFWIPELVNAMSAHGIQLLSRKLDIMPGVHTKLAIVRLLARSTKTVIVLSHDYFNDEMARFDLDLIERQQKANLVVIIVNMDIKQINGLPDNVMQILLDNEYFSYPSGVCMAAMGNMNAFVSTITQKLKQ